MRATGLVAAAVVCAVVVSTLPAGAAAAEGRVEGVVVSRATGKPVAGAIVSLPDLDASTRSLSDGSFSFPRGIPVTGPYRRIRAVVTAAGFGTWTISGVPVRPDDALRLNVQLRSTAWSHRVLTPEERGATPRRSPAGGGAATPEGSTCTGWDYSLTPPKTIWVWRSETDRAEKHDFLFYVQHVLPNEWISSWEPDSLAAGAIAVKTYAWYMTGSGHARVGGSECADIYDDWRDQVFDESWSAESTDLAVDATFGSVLRENGQIFPTQYWAGYAHDDPCAEVTQGEFAGRMSQWGTQTCALEGMEWPEIDTTFYPDAGWNYRNNLLLNGSLQSEPLYPWLKKNGTKITRVQGGSLDDASHLEVTPADGEKGVVYQSREYLGKSSTLYTAKAGFRCPSGSLSPCSIKFRVVAKDGDGASERQVWEVSVPRDGDWHTYTYNPDNAGIKHTFVELSFISYAPFDLDKTSLTTPYPG